MRNLYILAALFALGLSGCKSCNTTPTKTESASKPELFIKSAEPNGFREAMVSPDGKSVAIWLANSGNVELWSREQGAEPAKPYAVFPRAVGIVGFSSDSKIFMTEASPDLFLWKNEASTKPTPIATFMWDRIEHNREVSFVAEAGEGLITLWRLSEKGEESVKVFADASFSAISSDGKYLATYVNGTNQVRLWPLDPFQDRPLAQISLSLPENTGDMPEAKSMVFSPDGKTLAVQSSSFVELFRLDPIASPAKMAHVAFKEIDSVVFSPDGQTIAFNTVDPASFERSYRFMRNAKDATLGEPVAKNVQGFMFAPNSKNYFTTKEGEMSMWKVDGKPGDAPLLTLKSGLYRFPISPDGKYAAGEIEGKRVGVWNTENTADKKPVASFDAEDAAEFFTFTPDSKKVVIVSKTGVRIWPLP